MGKKGNWFSAVKRALSSESKQKREKKTGKSKGYFWKQKVQKLDALQTEPALETVTVTSSDEEKKLTEAENEKNMHVYSVALATAAAAEAAVAAAKAAEEVVRLTDVVRNSGKSKEEMEAIKIQTAFRGHLARRAFRALKGLARLKTMVQGQSVKRQATVTLKCMQTMARVQSEVRARRIRMTEENESLQRQLQQKHQEEEHGKMKVSTGDSWNGGTQSKEQIEAKLQSKQEAAIRRERALAYAYTHQQSWRNTPKYTNQTFMDSNNPHWGWSWLERWMASRPWELKTATQKEPNNDNTSVNSTFSRAVSAGELQRLHSCRDDNKPSPSVQRKGRPPSRQSPSTPHSHARTLSTGAGKLRSPSIRGSNIGTDEDLQSICSVQSDHRHHRRHSITGSSVRDDDSLASSPSVPSYMTPTKSAKAKSRLSSSFILEKNGTPDSRSVTSTKKRLSFSGSPPAPSRRHSVPPKIEIKGH